MHCLKSFLFFFSFALILSACNTGAASDPLLVEAFDFHTKAIEVEKIFVPKLEELRNKKNGIQIQGRALTEDEMSFIDATNRMESTYESWQKNRIEVPGFEHAHDHSGNCQHHHNSSKVQLTPQQMKEIQEESLQGIKDISNKINKLL